jgi:serine/threonine protein kinase
MRCPRCAFKGKPFQGRCAVCGYQLQEEDTQNSTSFTHINQQPFPYTDQPAPFMEQSPRLEQTPVTNWHTAMQTLGPGKLLRSGRYSIIASVALPQQNQGAAWNARDLHMSNRLVLLREIRIPAELASTALKREQMVTMLAQRLNRLGEHPGLPNIVDLFKEKDAYFLVFLLPQGRSLAQILKQRKGGLPEHTVAEYGWQLCDILSLLAEQQPPLVHGAISPETILISENGKQAALLHLPVLPPKEIPGGASTPSSYRAPEQVHGTLTPSSDLYALAATLYHAATGSDPQERPPAFYPPARRINPEVSVALERILARQLRLSATQRYGSAYEMQQDLAALIESYPTQASKSIVRTRALAIPAQVQQDEKSLMLPHRAWRRLLSLFMGVLMLLA